MDTQKNLLRRLLEYFPSKILPALTAFITTPIITHLFVPADYGALALALGVSNFLLASATSGIISGAVRFYAAYKARSQLNTFFTALAAAAGSAIIPFSLIAYGIIFLLRQQFSSLLYALLLICIATFAAQALNDILMGLLNAQQRSRLYTFFNLANRYASTGLSLLLVLAFGIGIGGMLWGPLIIDIVAIPLLIFFVGRGAKPSFDNLQIGDFKLMWIYAAPLTIGNLAMWSLRISDRYLIGLFRTQTEVGLYSASYNISGNSMEILTALFALSAFPMLVSAWETQGRGEAEKTLGVFTRIYLIIGLPMVVGLTILASPFISLLTSSAYHDGYKIVGYVASAEFFWELSQIASYGTLLQHQTGKIATNQIVAAVVNIGLNILLVPRFGFIVAGITTLVGFFVLFVLQAYASRKYLTWLFPWRTLLNVAIVATVMAVVTLWVYSLSGNLLGLRLGYLLVSVFLAIPTYFLSLWLLGEANDSEKAGATGIWRRLRKAPSRTDGG